jgi:hypothetical protein
MDNRPTEVSLDEMREMAAALKPEWRGWGAESAEEMFDILQDGYCVKFHFVNGSPGYVGDLFIFQGSYLVDARPFEFVRGRDGKLQLVE